MGGIRQPSISMLLSSLRALRVSVVSPISCFDTDARTEPDYPQAEPVSRLAGDGEEKKGKAGPTWGAPGGAEPRTGSGPGTEPPAAVTGGGLGLPEWHWTWFRPRFLAR